jgi:2-methylisocitrate lyase-like PEP mutase family enzyme
VSTFSDLHARGQLLILPNAWDAGSARLIESCGASAIATSSAAVAWAHGYPDGNALPPEMVVKAIERIARVIRIPLSVDSEGGYSNDPAKVAENIAAFVSAGAVGINLEDGTESPDLLCRKIESVKRATTVFINARIDVLLKELRPPDQAIEEVLSRAAQYRDAGADGIFVPVLRQPQEIETVVRAIDPLPLNVLAWPGLPPAADLRSLGVRRLSAGAWIGRAANAMVRQLATSFLAEGNSEAIYDLTDKTDMNALLHVTS